jgi:hypothetical protein
MQSAATFAGPLAGLQRHCGGDHLADAACPRLKVLARVSLRSPPRRRDGPVPADAGGGISCADRFTKTLSSAKPNQLGSSTVSTTWMTPFD